MVKMQATSDTLQKWCFMAAAVGAYIAIVVGLFMVMVVGKPDLPPPHFTDRYIISPGLAGAGVLASDYPLAAQFIRESGCVRPDEYFGSREMNCVLGKAGRIERVLPGSEARAALASLEGVLRRGRNDNEGNNKN